MICFIRYTSPGRLQNIIIDEVFWVIERICCEQIGCEMWLNYLLWLCRCQGGDNFTAMSKSHPTSQMLNPAQLGGIESSFVNFAFFIKSHMYNVHTGNLWMVSTTCCTWGTRLTRNVKFNDQQTSVESALVWGKIIGLCYDARKHIGELHVE